MTRLDEIRERANQPFNPENSRATMDADRDYLLSIIGRLVELADTYEQASDRFMREAKQKEEAGFTEGSALRYRKARSSIVFSSKIRRVIQ